MSPDELRGHGKDLLKLNYSQIKAVLLTVSQSLVILLDALIYGVEL